MFSGLYARTVPSHAMELTAIYLDRNVVGVLAAEPKSNASPPQKQGLAALIHLRGTGPGRAFVRRGFRAAAGKRYGNHLVATYIAKVNEIGRQFQKLAANGRS